MLSKCDFTKPLLFLRYYSEFFWFPNRGTDDGYWENCWKNDGNPDDAVPDLNTALEVKI